MFIGDHWFGQTFEILGALTYTNLINNTLSSGYSRDQRAFLTCFPKHGGVRDNKFLVTQPMTAQRC
jgi:hypothetical protein